MTIESRLTQNIYDLPTFIYGLDCIPVNKTDLDRLETKFRNVLRNIQSLPSVVATPSIYLCIGVLPAVAERDISILGLVGQIAECPRDLQSVADVIEDGLVKFDINFDCWSGLARRTSVLYGLEDPLDIIEQPWRSDRWRHHCKKVVTKYWLEVLVQSCETYSPHPICPGIIRNHHSLLFIILCQSHPAPCPMARRSTST